MSIVKPSPVRKWRQSAEPDLRRTIIIKIREVAKSPTTGEVNPKGGAQDTAQIHPVPAVITIIGGGRPRGSVWPPCRVPGRTSAAAALKRRMRKKIEVLTSSIATYKMGN